MITFGSFVFFFNAFLGLEGIQSKFFYPTLFFIYKGKIRCFPTQITMLIYCS